MGRGSSLVDPQQTLTRNGSGPQRLLVYVTTGINLAFSKVRK
jgi:hypothetical protein